MSQVPHWSASRFMVYDVCPEEFRIRYLDDGVPQLQTEAMCFGKAVHQGLEAHYQGGDGEFVFRRAWREYAAELRADGQYVDPRLSSTGLYLLDSVFELQLQGQPEHGFSLDTEAELGAPIVGAVDLWGDGTIYDFKTTVGAWSQMRAQKEVWQPCLYTWAYWDATAVWPAFEYVVLNRATRGLSRFRREWTAEEYLAHMDDAWGRMRAIASAVAADALTCHGQHGFCLECGDRWSHGHLCVGQNIRS